MALTQAQIESAYAALSFGYDAKQLYDQIAAMVTKIDRYLAGTDLVFNAAVDAVVSAEDRARIAALRTPLADMKTMLETDYPDFIAPA